MVLPKTLGICLACQHHEYLRTLCCWHYVHSQKRTQTMNLALKRYTGFDQTAAERLQTTETAIICSECPGDIYANVNTVQPTLCI